MKTAISIPDDLAAKIDAEARRRGVSRSRWIAETLEAYFADKTSGRRGRAITEEFNRVCAEVDTSLPPDLRSQPARVLDADAW